jgi:glycosyltransferase involved in cell wall biosynthesis
MSLSFIAAWNDTIPRFAATSDSVSDSVEDRFVLSTVKPTPKISVVIPAFNESTRIRESLEKIEYYLGRRNFHSEVIVVDDGSTDDTVAICESTKFPNLRVIRNTQNQGKGFSVRNGVRAAIGDYVLFTDADLSAPIDELDKLLAAASKENADVVIGSRGIDNGLIEKHQSPMRENGGRFFNFMVRMILGLNILDTQCGFKLFKRSSVQKAFEKQTTNGFGFDPELLFVMSKQGLRILEIPVRWSHVEGSKIRFFSHGMRMFVDLLRIRWNNLIGRYS